MPVRPAKDPNIETLRGLAILLVVAGHVIGIDATGGMKVADDSLWRYLYASLQYVRMPLFTAISGWVYALHPVAAHEAGTFMFKKARRLLLPMICVGTLYFLIQYITPGTNRTGELAEIWKIYLLPYTVYWYLPALFLIFGAVAALDVHGACTTLRRWGMWLLIACAGVLIEPQLSSRLPNVFSIWGALCLLPFFCWASESVDSGPNSPLPPCGVFISPDSSPACWSSSSSGFQRAIRMCSAHGSCTCPSASSPRLSC